MMKYGVNYTFITFAKQHYGTVIVIGADNEEEAKKTVIGTKPKVTITDVYTKLPCYWEDLQIIPVRPDFSAFSVLPFIFKFHGKDFKYYAIAVNNEIVWKYDTDDSKTPIYWANKAEELQDMINKKDPRLLGLLN